MNRVVQVAAADAIARAIKAQPWYRRYSGTVAAVAGVAVAFGTSDLVSVVGAPRWVDALVTFAVAVFVGVAARLTPNGLTPRGTKQTLDVIADVPATRGVNEIISAALDGVAITDSFGRPIEQAQSAVMDSWGRS